MTIHGRSTLLFLMVLIASPLFAIAKATDRPQSSTSATLAAQTGGSDAACPSAQFANAGAATQASESSQAGQSAAQASRPDDKSKADQKAQIERAGLDLLNEVAIDAGSLRLPENRVHVEASAARLLWKYDQKRARALFQEATGTLAASIRALDRTSPDYGSQYGLAVALRQELLNWASQMDPAMAVDFLAATKLPPGPGETSGNDMETNLKLQLASQIAVGDPSRAFQIAESSRKNGPSGGLVGVIAELQSADIDSAQKLATDLAGDLQSQDLAANPEAASAAFSLLTMALSGNSNGNQTNSDPDAQKQPQSILSPQAMKALLSQILAAANSPSPDSSTAQETIILDGPPANVGKTARVLPGNGNFASTLLPQLSAFLPALQQLDAQQAAVISEKVAEFNSANSPAPGLEITNTSTVDDILAMAPKVDSSLRPALFVQAINKASAEGDFDRARQIIDDDFPDPAYRQQLLDQIDQQKASKATEENKLEGALQSASQIRSKDSRLQALIQLASTAMDKSDQKLATQILNDVQSQLSLHAENYNQLNMRFAVAALISRIDPERTVEAFRGGCDQLTALISAASVLNGFEVQGVFRDGEMVLSSPAGSLANSLDGLASALVMVARNDPAQAIAAMGGLQPPEASLLVRLQMAQGLLSGDGNGGANGRAPVSGSVDATVVR